MREASLYSRHRAQEFDLHSYEKHHDDRNDHSLFSHCSRIFCISRGHPLLRLAVILATHQYTCYGTFLCPIISGEPTLKCANACYLPEAYTCANGQNLTLHPTISHTYTLSVIQAGIPDLDGLAISACGREFYLRGNSCTYCPSSVASTGQCAVTTNTTVFNPGSTSLSTIVPGGQFIYIDPTGAMGFSQAHSSEYPPGSDLANFAAYGE